MRTTSITRQPSFSNSLLLVQSFFSLTFVLLVLFFLTPADLFAQEKRNSRSSFLTPVAHPPEESSSPPTRSPQIASRTFSSSQPNLETRRKSQQTTRQPTEKKPHPAIARISVQESGARAFGSGTLVDVREKYGLVITNWHVVRDATGPIEVVFPGGFTTQARVLKVDKDWDLAALVIWTPPVAPIRLSQVAPIRGDLLTICGYGQGRYRALTGRCTQYYAPNTNLPREMVEVDVQARQGDSGGPILNARGEMAGVLFGASDGTTLGSFGPRISKFLASLASDIGKPLTEPASGSRLAERRNGATRSNFKHPTAEQIVAISQTAPRQISQTAPLANQLVSVPTESMLAPRSPSQQPKKPPAQSALAFADSLLDQPRPLYHDTPHRYETPTYTSSVKNSKSSQEHGQEQGQLAFSDPRSSQSAHGRNANFQSRSRNSSQRLSEEAWSQKLRSQGAWSQATEPQEALAQQAAAPTVTKRSLLAQIPSPTRQPAAGFSADSNFANSPLQQTTFGHLKSMFAIIGLLFVLFQIIRIIT